jgi:hypothetical protein
MELLCRRLCLLRQVQEEMKKAFDKIAPADDAAVVPMLVCFYASAQVSEDVRGPCWHKSTFVPGCERLSHDRAVNMVCAAPGAAAAV